VDFDGDGRVSLAEFRRFWGEFCDPFSAIFEFFLMKTRFLGGKMSEIARELSEFWCFFSKLFLKTPK
jgi:hypothetical protein